MSISQNKGMLSHDESRKIVTRITMTLQKTPLYYSHIPSLNVYLYNIACSFVSIFALSLVVLCRVFFRHVSLEIKGLSALVVALSTGKGPLARVRSHVFL